MVIPMGYVYVVQLRVFDKAFQRGIDFRRQNLTFFLTSKVDSRTVRINIFITVADQYHMCSNEPERAN